MDTVGTGSASQFRLSERQVGWKPPHPPRTPTWHRPEFRLEGPQICFINMPNSGLNF
jgi:hypothetical protein